MSYLTQAQVLMSQADDIHAQMNAYLHAGFNRLAKLERKKLQPIGVKLSELQERINSEDTEYMAQVETARSYVIANS